MVWGKIQGQDKQNGQALLELVPGTGIQGLSGDEDLGAVRNRKHLSLALALALALALSVFLSVSAFLITFLDYCLYHLTMLAHSYFTFTYNFCLCLLMNLSMHVFHFFSTLPFGLSQFRCSRERI